MIVYCKKCGLPMSDLAAVCPRCKYVMNPEKVALAEQDATSTEQEGVPVMPTMPVMPTIAPQSAPVTEPPVTEPLSRPEEFLSHSDESEPVEEVYTHTPPISLERVVCPPLPPEPPTLFPPTSAEQPPLFPPISAEQPTSFPPISGEPVTPPPFMSPILPTTPPPFPPPSGSVGYPPQQPAKRSLGVWIAVGIILAVVYVFVIAVAVIRAEEEYYNDYLYDDYSYDDSDFSWDE